MPACEQRNLMYEDSAVCVCGIFIELVDNKKFVMCMSLCCKDICSMIFVQCPHGGIVILPQPSAMFVSLCPHRATAASTQCDVDPVCVPIEPSSTQCDVDPVCAPIEPSSTLCDVDPVCDPMY